LDISSSISAMRFDLLGRSKRVLEMFQVGLELLESVVKVAGVLFHGCSL
tara:strand:- start:586 stop:732 length:147 start_codon:yes stop_codon:yes gene_type:complete